MQRTWMSDPQRLYRKEFQFLMTRKRNIFLRVIHIMQCNYNKISHPLNQSLKKNWLRSLCKETHKATHWWTDSIMLAKDPSFSSKMHWFLSLHRVQMTVYITKNHKSLVLLSLRNMKSPTMRWLTSWGRTQDTLHFCIIFVQTLSATEQCKNKWLTDSIPFLHITHQLEETDKNGCLFLQKILSVQFFKY